MKNKDLYAFVNRVDQLKDLSGIKLSYCLIKNKKEFINEISILEEVKKPTSKFLEYDKKRIEIAQKYSKKDKDGNPEVSNNGIIIDKSKIEEANKQLKSLGGEYKKEIEEHSKKMDEFNKLMDKDASVNVHQIEFKDIPEGITPIQMEIMYELIKDKK